MINNLYFEYFIIFLLFQVKCAQKKEYMTHPIQIKVDPANLDINNINHKNMLYYLNDAIKILSKLINCIDEKKNEITPEIIRRKCKRKFKISDITTNKPDIIIFPIFDKLQYFERDDNDDIFKALICELNPSEMIQPNIALFFINKYTNINSLTNTPEKKYMFKLQMFKYLLDCLGLNFRYRIKIRQPKNNFFETPLYLIENYFSYNSLKKLYRLNNIQLPKREIDEIGLFYDPFWPDELIIKDFLSQNIDIKYDMTETSFNLLNDFNYYHLSKCDMILDKKGKCHRIDQKCISEDDFDNNYYLQYGIHNSKLICYFSNKNNILNNRCGNKYGFLLNEIIDYCPLIMKKIDNKKIIGDYDIPELSYNDEQELKLITPSKKCHPEMPMTIYFRSDYKTNLFNLNDIVLSKENSKYFVTFEIFEDIYIHHNFLLLTKFNGLIRSYLDYGNHNLFINILDEKFLKENKNDLKLNKFQKIFNFVGSNIFSEKDLLNNIYKNQKKLFPNEYNFIQETYLYPEDKDKINELFMNYKIDNNNLWIIKPKNEYSGNDIHIFKLLNDEKEDFIITRYINNPHLLNEKKYTLRVFVLVSGLKPLRIYLNKEGIILLAREKFNLEPKNLNNKYIHLTNNEIIKELDSFRKYEKKPRHKMYFKEYIEYLKKNNNIDYTLLINKLIDIIIKTVIAGYDYLLSKLDEFNLNDRNFFNLYGYDFLIDNEYEPYLLDIDKRPNMFIYDNIDKYIKERIFVDTLNIVGITPFSHDENQETLDEIFVYDDPIQEAVEYAFCELTRPKGYFDLIFPLKKNIDKYAKFFRKKNIENEKFWDKIKNEE